MSVDGLKIFFSDKDNPCVVRQVVSLAQNLQHLKPDIKIELYEGISDLLPTPSAIILPSEEKRFGIIAVIGLILDLKK